MKLIFLVVAVVMLGACVPYQPVYRINEVRVVNHTGAAISDVSWRILGTDKSRQCSEVANFAMCYEYFARRKYPQAGIEVNWTHSQGGQKTETLSPAVPAYFSTTFPLRAVLEIKQDGSIDGYYQQDEPDGRIFVVP